ncbi:MAG: tape measure domain-containing protein, partial [Pseudomonas stutzeri]|nr:tape measure domain-containing protein [Stutzerimonas stutzeri]
DRDITAISAALRRLYDDGQVGASEYNAELAKLSARQKELKQALEGGKKAQDDKNKSDKDAIVTSEQLRRESGKRMEAERRAGDEAMQRRRKESSDAKRDMSAMEGFFSGVVSRAREPLAAMSAAALEFYDRLRGINSVNVSIDTSSLDATRQSLAQVTAKLAELQRAAANPMMSSIGRWALETQQASLQAQQAFLGQKSALQSLMGDYERGNLTAREFVRSANSMRRALSLLDDSDLSSLESAIAAAEQRMQQMGESTRSTLDSLQDELDNLQGRTEDIERRRFASRRRELEAQLAEANAQGDSQAVANASRALGMLR